MNRDQRVLLVDASVFITLAEIGRAELLRTLDGRLRMPDAVVDEIRADPACTVLQRAIGEWLETLRSLRLAESPIGPTGEFVPEAASYLGVEDAQEAETGDVALLALALYERRDTEVVVVTDDKPLRDACKSLGIDVSGSIGVLVAAVEVGGLDGHEAKDALYAMDEVGARLSAGLVRRAERLIDEADD